MMRTILLLILWFANQQHSWSSSEPALTWSISVKDSKHAKDILSEIRGEVKRGSLHAIIGSSGSGKTTLLNVLAGARTDGLHVLGFSQSTYDCSPVYVQQEDLLFPQLTVKETLQTSLSLRSSVQSSRRDRNARVNKLILDLGLKKVADTRVGDSKTRGISGGEKKRLAIGNEIAMASDVEDKGRRLIFADEPTSGLDSFQAHNVVSLLKDLTTTGNSVMISIHQPRSSVSL